MKSLYLISVMRQLQTNTNWNETKIQIISQIQIQYKHRYNFDPANNLNWEAQLDQPLCNMLPPENKFERNFAKQIQVIGFRAL